jgi:hypothetical protein
VRSRSAPLHLSQASAQQDTRSPGVTTHRHQQGANGRVRARHHREIRRRRVHESATPRFAGRLRSRARRLVSIVTFDRSLQPSPRRVASPRQTRKPGKASRSPRPHPTARFRAPQRTVTPHAAGSVPSSSVACPFLLFPQRLPPGLAFGQGLSASVTGEECHERLRVDTR